MNKLNVIVDGLMNISDSISELVIENQPIKGNKYIVSLESGFFEGVFDKSKLFIDDNNIHLNLVFNKIKKDGSLSKVNRTVDIDQIIGIKEA